MANTVEMNEEHQLDHSRAGFTIAELVVVLILVSMALAMAVPRMSTPPLKQAEWVAQQIVRDIELARARAQSTRKRVQMNFAAGAQRYASYLDHDRDGSFSENAAEMAAFLGGKINYMNTEIRFGRGSAASAAPGDGGSGPVTFASGRLTLDSRGIPAPVGTEGYIYVHHMNAPEAVAAIRVSPSGSTEIYMYTGGVWQ